MKRILKWVGIILGSFVILFVVAAVALAVAGGAQLTRTVSVEPPLLTIPTHAVALARGEHLVNVACMDCHGPDLAGRAMLDDPAIGSIYAPSLTGLAEITRTRTWYGPSATAWTRTGDA